MGWVRRDVKLMRSPIIESLFEQRSLLRHFVLGDVRGGYERRQGLGSRAAKLKPWALRRVRF
jgi:hypothetical protein